MDSLENLHALDRRSRHIVFADENRTFLRSGDIRQRFFDASTSSRKINKCPRSRGKEEKHKKWSWNRARCGEPKRNNLKEKRNIYASNIYFTKGMRSYKNTFPFRRLVRFEWNSIRRKTNDDGQRKSSARRVERDTYERRIDACLVIQVAGNDFTSSNLRLYTYFYLMWRFYCYVKRASERRNGMSGI